MDLLLSNPEWAEELLEPENIMAMDKEDRYELLAYSEALKTDRQRREFVDLIRLVAAARDEPLKPVICKFYNTPGGCWNGHDCEFAHVDKILNASSVTTNRICKFYKRSGGCT